MSVGCVVSMRIVQIITRSDAIGGAHVHVRDLARRLMQEGHEVIVLVGGDGPFVEDLARHNIPFRSMSHLVRPIRVRNDLKAFFELRSVLKTLCPDVVATHSSKAGWLGRLAARSLGLPVVFTAHGWAFTEGVPRKHRILYSLAERIASRYADRIVTVSEFDRSLALRYGIAPEHKLVTIHNGMPDVQSKFVAQPDLSPPRIVMVARFDIPKDHRTLLRALAQLVDLPWELELVGDGPLRNDIENYANSLRIRERVAFLGARADVAKRLARAQVFALISRWEGLPLTILEGMRAGLPVIASDVGGVREVVTDGENGFLVSRGDSYALAKKLRVLLCDPQVRLRMGRQGRRRYEQSFQFEHMYEKTLRVYSEIIHPR